MRLTRAAPARPTSSWTWPMFRRSAPLTAASNGSTAFFRRGATLRRGNAARRLFFDALVLDALFLETFLFFVMIDVSTIVALAKPKLACHERRLELCG